MSDTTGSKDRTKDRQHRGRPFRGKRLKTMLPKPVVEVPLPEPKAAERIAKVIARAGLTSRREAEAWIEAGRVSVNGGVVRSPGPNARPEDRIAVDGKPFPTPERTPLFPFNKTPAPGPTHPRPGGPPTA